MVFVSGAELQPAVDARAGVLSLIEKATAEHDLAAISGFEEFRCRKSVHDRQRDAAAARAERSDAHGQSLRVTADIQTAVLYLYSEGGQHGHKAEQRPAR